MTDWPSDEYVEAARQTARTFARRRGQTSERDDFESEAVVALHEHWPALTRRYGTPSRRIVCGAVRHWLTDYCRREYGRRHPKAFSWRTSLNYDPASGDDTAESAVARLDLNLEELIDAICEVECLGPVWTARERVLLRRLAYGLPMTRYADELGISVNAIDQVLMKLRAALRADPRIRALR